MNKYVKRMNTLEKSKNQPINLKLVNKWNKTLLRWLNKLKKPQKSTINKLNMVPIQMNYNRNLYKS